MAYSYSYTNNNVVFSNLQDVGNQYPVIHRLNKFENIQKFIDKGITPVVKPFVNAVEIDWNAAQLGEETISNNCESHCSMIVPAIAA